MNQTDFESGAQLKIDGYKYKGFGIIPKTIMFDQNLSIEAKAIFAYFCSLAGNKASAFPKRDTVLKHLNISKDYYYKNFNQLVNNGHIVIQKIGKFPFKNLYVLRGKQLEDSNYVESEDTTSKLYSSGFGVVPRDLMLNPDIPIKSKGIYAYLCALSGSNSSAFPKVDSILLDLSIGKQTYHKYFKCLVESNYITVKQRKVNGRFSINDYTINNDLERQIGNSKNNLDNKKCPSVSSVKIKDNVVQDTRAKDTNKNTPVTKNNFFEYNLSDSLKMPVNTEKQKLMDINNIDFELLKRQHSPDLVEFINELIHYVIRSKSKSTKINGELMSTELVKTQFAKLRLNHIIQVIDGINSTKKEIKNKRSYILTALFNSINVIDLSTKIKTKKDHNAQLIEREKHYSEEELEKMLLTRRKRLVE